MKIMKHLQDKVNKESKKYSRFGDREIFQEGASFMWVQLSGVVESLEFYADEFSWRTNSGKIGITPLTDGSDYDIINNQPTNGKRAREALKRLIWEVID